MTSNEDTMTTTEQSPDPITQAITALSAAARRTRVRGAGTEHAQVEPVDFAEIACHVLTTVAANVGGVEALLAGWPGSWEADYVRQIVHSTAGTEPGDLLRWRTEPVRLVLDVEDTFYDFGLTQMYDEERADAITRESDETMTEDQAAEAAAITEAIDTLWEQDKAAYLTAYTAAVRAALTEHGVTCDVEVVELVRGETETWDYLSSQLHEVARARTPLPMTGEAPDWSAGTPAEALRRAGLTYTARAQETLR